MINVTKPFLPPQEEYSKYINKIWNTVWLTNNGPLLNELEFKLKNYFGVKSLFFVSNGTIALQLAIKALNITKEVITTPFSFVATTTSILWEGASPIFVDIDKNTLNIDVNKIEQAITPKTEAILATHVYGNSCNIDKIQEIAKKHKLKIIYDGAHAFGTKYKENSVLTYGDISTISFHATKLFHTVEGGAIIVKDKSVAERIKYLRNFGHDGPSKFNGIGINAKNSEFHAAMGLTNFKYISSILEKRKNDSLYYNELLHGLNVFNPNITQSSKYNYAYYPVIFKNEEICLAVFNMLEINKIYSRRYFYPSLSKLPYIKNQKMPVSENIAKRVLCLPLYYDLKRTEIAEVCRNIINYIK